MRETVIPRRDDPKQVGRILPKWRRHLRSIGERFSARGVIGVIIGIDSRRRRRRRLLDLLRLRQAGAASTRS
ncbi:MAG: hypothetical protein MZV64_70850 [Ignavibacteriales bacterium]|nr:hypothetical protein [Ignavibacteriales bacterium]